MLQHAQKFVQNFEKYLKAWVPESEKKPPTHCGQSVKLFLTYWFGKSENGDTSLSYDSNNSTTDGRVEIRNPQPWTVYVVYYIEDAEDAEDGGYDHTSVVFLHNRKLYQIESYIDKKSITVEELPREETIYQAIEIYEERLDT